MSENDHQDGQNTSPFMGGQVDTDAQQYDERKRYSAYSSNYAIGTPLLDTVEDRKLYGFLDHNYHPIEPNAEIQPTSGQPIGVKTFGDYSPEIYGLNFVVDLFTSFRNYYIDLMRRTGLTLPEEISPLVPTRSFNEVDTDILQYERYLSTKINNYLISEEFVPQEEHPLNLQKYLNYVSTAMFENEMLKDSITKSGFLLSPRSTVYNTGLYIDLFSGGNPEIDLDKQKILEYDGFKCFVEKAWEHGFYVDKNCPWRLVLNLESLKVKKNIMFSNGENPTRQLLRFNDFYSNQKTLKTGLDDYWFLRDFIKKAFYDYRMQLEEESMTDIYINNEMNSIATETWLEHLIKYRLKELGYFKKRDLLDQESPRYSLFQEILAQALFRLNLSQLYENPNSGEPLLELYGLEGTSGALKYIEARCAGIIKHEIEKSKKKSFNNRHTTGYLSESTIDLTNS